MLARVATVDTIRQIDSSPSLLTKQGVGFSFSLSFLFKQFLIVVPMKSFGLSRLLAAKGMSEEDGAEKRLGPSNPNTTTMWDKGIFYEFFERSNDQCVSFLRQGYFTKDEQDKIKSHWSNIVPILKTISDNQENPDN